MAVDRTKLIFYSGNPAFMQNSVALAGTKIISGTTNPGTNTQTFTVTLTDIPDMIDILFNGPVAGADPRPSDGWFKQGSIWVPSTVAGGTSDWKIYSNITDSTTMTIMAIHVQTVTGTQTLTPTNFSYRVIDYSVF